VYESYFAQVQASNPTPKIHPYFDRLIKPLLERENTVLEDPEAAMGLDEELAEMKAEREEAEAAVKEKGMGKEGRVRKEEFSGVLLGDKVDE
jgi:acyl-CoA oxidase